MQGRNRLAAGCVTVVVLSAVDIVVHGPLRHLDGLIGKHYTDARIAHIGTTIHIADVFSQIGRPALACLIVGGLGAVAALIHRRIGPAVAATVGLAVVGVATWVLKHLVPYPGIFFHQPGSFPSGHTGVAVVSAGLIARFLLKPSPHRDTYAIAYAAAWGALMGWSRVVLPAHWLSDVLAGWSLGMIALILALRVADTTTDSDSLRSRLPRLPRSRS